MWGPFRRPSFAWKIPPIASEPRSASDALKAEAEVRMLRLLLPLIMTSEPREVFKRESPDFEVRTLWGSLYIEIVDAVPDAISTGKPVNLEERRSRQNNEPYSVHAHQFGRTIAHAVEGKRVKAKGWVQRDSNLEGHLGLIVNGGIGPLTLRHYFNDHHVLAQMLPLADVTPFSAVVVGDESGGFVWGAVAFDASKGPCDVDP